MSRLFDAYFNPEEEEEETESSTKRNLVIPWDSPPFPFADHLGPVVGYRDTSVYPLMDAIYHGPNGAWWKKSRIKIYGWADPSYNASTSRNSNIPLAYSTGQKAYDNGTKRDQFTFNWDIIFRF